MTSLLVALITLDFALPVLAAWRSLATPKGRHAGKVPHFAAYGAGITRAF